MFLGFLLFLRAGGFKVSMHDWLALMEGLQAGLHGQSMRGFYILCRALLVKSESDLDKFEDLFYRYFRNVDPQKLRAEIAGLKELPELVERAFAPYMDKKDMDLRTIMAAMETRLAESDGDSDGSPVFGSSEVAGNASAGIGAGPGTGGGTMVQGAGGKSVIHARGDRKFRDWRTDCTIESRQFQMAFRLLRELSRKLENSEEERSTARAAAAGSSIYGCSRREKTG